MTLGSGGINNICIETGCSEATVKWSRRRQECRTLLQQRNQGGLIVGASIPHWTLRVRMLYGRCEQLIYASTTHTDNPGPPGNRMCS